MISTTSTTILTELGKIIIKETWVQSMVTQKCTMTLDQLRRPKWKTGEKVGRTGVQKWAMKVKEITKEGRKIMGTMVLSISAYFKRCIRKLLINESTENLRQLLWKVQVL